jgi:diguanylate cyclase (GGDEF)-like protein
MNRDTSSRLSWLCQSQSDRDRLLDMEKRIKPLRAVAFAILAVSLLACGPWVGWWTLIPLAAAGTGFAICDATLGLARRPEYMLAAAWLIAELTIAASVALTGGPRSPAVAWLVLPVVTLAARFDSRGVVAGSVLAVGLILASTIGVAPADVFAHPQHVVFPLALLGSVTLFSLALMTSDRHHRATSVIDPLTTMLNRNALITRVEELRHQARLVHQPIGMILGDLDCFKQINDRHGHLAGDRVLQDVAYSLRKQLRAFDLAYRLGGEEFLVLLPGADVEQSTAIAEKLRRTIAAREHGGLPVTISFGVTASKPGSFDYDDVVAAVDRALYRAKAAGRNRVEATITDRDDGGPPVHGPLIPWHRTAGVHAVAR